MAFPKLPETAEEISAFWQKMDEKDASDVQLELHFSKEELEQMCDYEKLRVSNVKRNYEMMKELGLPVKKPLFMQKNKKRKREEYSSSSESDEEWTPASERPKKKARVGPVKSIWVTPTKKAPKKQAAASTEEEVEDLSECDFDGFDADEKISTMEELKPFKKDRRRLKRELKKGVINVEENMLDYPADLEQFDMEAAKQKKRGRKTKKPYYMPEIVENRYPKRNIPVKDYASLEVPDDDHFLFCDDCHEEYLGDCPVHGPLKIIEDSKAEEGSENYAKNTAPPHLLVKDSQVPNGGLGVWCNEHMEKGVRLGPYKGEKVKTEDKAHVSGYSWQIYGQKERQGHFVDAGDTTSSNWMRYVNCARNEGEQNLLAFQYKGEIFYRTIQDVPAGCELFVWYGDEYGRELLGINTSPQQHVQQLMSLLQHQQKQRGEKVPFWNIHGRKLEVPRSEWKLPVPHNKGFPCDVCGVAFVKEEFMQTHRKNTHRELYREAGKKHQCKHCSYSSDKTSNLAHHMLVHTAERPFKCQQCGKGFTQASSLKAHEKIHSGNKPYQCKICDKRFIQLSNLSTHMNIHNNTRSFQCTFCDKAFTWHVAYKCHLKIHTDVLDFACAHCDHKTNRASSLKKHVIIHHTHEYPHHCPVCNKGYVQPSEMRKHIANNH